jgi:hypothetical protein
VGGGGGGGGAIGGEAGGYDNGANNAGYGGGGGSGTADGTGTTNVSGESGSLGGGSSGGGFLDISRKGDFSNTVLITGISNLSTSGWTAGMYITGQGIPDGTTIVAVISAAGTILISQATSTGNNNVDLAVADYYYDISRVADLTNGSTTISVSPSVSSWAAGMNVTGSGIRSGTTIVSATGTTVVLSQAATSNANNVNITVFAASSGSSGSSPGGSTDLNYAPSYASAYGSPGKGGAAGSVNGQAGAVVVFW